ncbi:hypothetical protein DOTSEDRAFT_41457 [Dothistroma septosporum NZE10]|uniref:Uncharacterized protein n=1 Tax=Dothistroma septosporum (strain NZE10 / CBS 128990) TaxID=675120 RepID=N1Q3U5_DOTSN|nr:hypothetical protein DOTSEDRAFT_41457 [Dothistroma septosporum NZE10]
MLDDHDEERETESGDDYPSRRFCSSLVHLGKGTISVDLSGKRMSKILAHTLQLLAVILRCDPQKRIHMAFANDQVVASNFSADDRHREPDSNGYNVSPGALGFGQHSTLLFVVAVSPLLGE